MLGYEESPFMETAYEYWNEDSAGEADGQHQEWAEEAATVPAMPEGYENWKRFPCWSRDSEETDANGDPLHKAKSPLTTHGYKDATNDPEQIEAWKREFPDCMWGVATGDVNGFVVMDLDRHEGGADGAESLFRYYNEHGYKFTPTLTARTAGGGWHCYYKVPDGVTIPTKAGVLPGVDVRGNGGYVIVPPSMNQETGNAYEWENPSQPMAEIPECLMELFLKKTEKPTLSANTALVSRPLVDGGTAYGNAALAGERKETSEAANGTRNDTLFTSALKVFGLVKAGELERELR